MPTRGVFYMGWGDAHRRYLDRSIASVRQFNPDIQIELDWRESGDLLDKAEMAKKSPFDTTLFLDVDTVVLGDLSYAFEKAETHGLACCICEEPWARRYPSIRGDVIEYNTGVMCFTAGARPVFDLWSKSVRAIDSSIRLKDNTGKVSTMESNDQAAFSLAVSELNFNPFVLPLNWNYRPLWQKSWWGDIRIWHDYRPVPPSLYTLNEQQLRPGAVMEYAEIQ